jgi:hypothetical protein
MIIRSIATLAVLLLLATPSHAATLFVCLASKGKVTNTHVEPGSWGCRGGTVAPFDLDGNASEIAALKMQVAALQAVLADEPWIPDVPPPAAGNPVQDAIDDLRIVGAAPTSQLAISKDLFLRYVEVHDFERARKWGLKHVELARQYPGGPNFADAVNMVIAGLESLLP